ncbi:Aspyridones efflux protein apdF [Psilocybe cubensis]|uniref:Aspyridones efflux protein apdF n=2 Tax=Psilocybe cubensis TaxID=181762 RepID=A0ACB8H9A1_PSICU|nr:Aspyridones efflux protein apdF [Psilocybe cubensis]KAH9484578.1 Aspyridones efflux protein apdF [Psilocybe cubensis]
MTSLHDEHLNDSRYSHDITIENVRSSRADSMSSTSKEKYTVHSTIEAASTKDKEEGEVEDDYPDGGTRAWLILAGAMCNTFSTFGYVNSWGIFQKYYEETLLSSSSPSTIAWIGSIQYSLVFLPGLIVGRLFDLGYFRSIFLISSAILVGATFLVAQCTQYWHFLLCQGFVVGFGCGGIFGPTTAVIAHWFKKRRGFAMGLVAVGSSLGGTILPITANNLIPRVGFKWTMRIFGFILLTTLGMSNLLLKRRLPPKKVAGGLLNLAAFKSAPYSVYCASAFVTFLGIYTGEFNRSLLCSRLILIPTVLTYVGVSATDIGISSDFAFYFIAIANASSLFGRYVAGNLCDKLVVLGAMNVMIPFTVSAGIVTYAWPFAQTKSSLIAITVIYGFASGSYVSLLSNPIMEMGETGDVGRRIGMFMSILAIGALAGPPISGAIGTATGDFKAVGYYAGTAVLVGVGLMSITRHLILKRMFGKI